MAIVSVLIAALTAIFFGMAVGQPTLAVAPTVVISAAAFVAAVAVALDGLSIKHYAAARRHAGKVRKYVPNIRRPGITAKARGSRPLPALPQPEMRVWACTVDDYDVVLRSLVDEVHCIRQSRDYAGECGGLEGETLAQHVAECESIKESLTHIWEVVSLAWADKVSLAQPRQVPQCTVFDNRSDYGVCAGCGAFAEVLPGPVPGSSHLMLCADCGNAEYEYLCRYGVNDDPTFDQVWDASAADGNKCRVCGEPCDGPVCGPDCMEAGAENRAACRAFGCQGEKLDADGRCVWCGEKPDDEQHGEWAELDGIGAAFVGGSFDRKAVARPSFSAAVADVDLSALEDMVRYEVGKDGTFHAWTRIVRDGVEEWVETARQSWFLQLVAGGGIAAKRGHDFVQKDEFKASALVARVMAPDVNGNVAPTKDGLSFVMPANRRPLPLVQDTSAAKGAKGDKRVTRLFGATTFGALLNAEQWLRVVDLKRYFSNPRQRAWMEAALDGAEVLLGLDVVREVANRSAHRLNGWAAKEVMDAYKDIASAVRRGEPVPVKITGMTTDGQLKGMAIVSKHVQGIVVRGTKAFKRELKLDATLAGKVYLAFDAAHGTDLRVDRQMYAMEPDIWSDVLDQLESNLKDAIQEMDSDSLDDILANSFSENVVRQTLRRMGRHGIEFDPAWQGAIEDSVFFTEYVARGGKVNDFSQVLRSVARATSKQLDSCYAEGAVPLRKAKRVLAGATHPRGPWAHEITQKRLYIFTDVALGWFPAEPEIWRPANGLPRAIYPTLGDAESWLPGSFRLSFNRFATTENVLVVSAFVWKRIAAILGGADQDDLVALKRWLDTVWLKRSPSQTGEIVGFKDDGSIVWPKATGIEYLGWGQGRRSTIPEGQTWKRVMAVAEIMADGMGAIGLTAKYFRIYKLTMGKCPPKMVASMSDVVDRVVQMQDASAAKKFAREALVELAEQSMLDGGTPLPNSLWEELYHMLNQRVEVAYEDDKATSPYAIDAFTLRYERIVDDWRKAVKTKANGCLGLTKDGKGLLAHFIGGDPLAVKLRSGVFNITGGEERGKLTDEELVERLRQAGEYIDAILSQIIAEFGRDEAAEVVGACLGRAYKDANGRKEIHDWIPFATKLTRGLLIEALVRRGFLGEIAPIERQADGSFKLALNDGQRQKEARVSQAVLYDAWMYLGRGTDRAVRQAVTSKANWAAKLEGSRIRWERLADKWAAVCGSQRVGVAPKGWEPAEPDAEWTIKETASDAGDGRIVVILA